MLTGYNGLSTSICLTQSGKLIAQDISADGKFSGYYVLHDGPFSEFRAITVTTPDNKKRIEVFGVRSFDRLVYRFVEITGLGYPTDPVADISQNQRWSKNLNSLVPKDPLRPHFGVSISVASHPDLVNAVQVTVSAQGHIYKCSFSSGEFVAGPSRWGRAERGFDSAKSVAVIPRDSSWEVVYANSRSGELVSSYGNAYVTLSSDNYEKLQCTYDSSKRAAHLFGSMNGKHIHYYSRQDGPWSGPTDLGQEFRDYGVSVTPAGQLIVAAVNEKIEIWQNILETSTGVWSGWQEIGIELEMAEELAALRKHMSLFNTRSISENPGDVYYDTQNGVASSVLMDEPEVKELERLTTDICTRALQRAAFDSAVAVVVRTPPAISRAVTSVVTAGAICTAVRPEPSPPPNPPAPEPSPSPSPSESSPGDIGSDPPNRAPRSVEWAGPDMNEGGGFAEMTA